MLHGREYTNIRYANDQSRDSSIVTSPTSSMHGSMNSLYACLTKTNLIQSPLPPTQNILPLVNRETKRVARPVSETHLPR